MQQIRMARKLRDGSKTAKTAIVFSVRERGGIGAGPLLVSMSLLCMRRTAGQAESVLDTHKICDHLGAMTIRELIQQGGGDAVIAARSGLDRTTVSRVRRGVSDPPLSTVERIAAAAGGRVVIEAAPQDASALSAGV